jgi:hypothetical protein
MNPYAVIGNGMGTPEAVSLGIRLSTWHDAMVAHERRLRSTPSKDACHDECPHAEARDLWAEAVDTFGPLACELAFLRSRGKGQRASRRGISADGTASAVDYATSSDEGARL